MIKHRLIEQLKRQEGFRDKPYYDSVGKLTVGYGRNLEDTELRQDEAELMLLNDVTQSYLDANRLIPGFSQLNHLRQNVIVNMVFNMGVSRVRKFKKTIARLAINDFDGAAREMLDSKWAQQVGSRAVELAQQMRTGHDKPWIGDPDRFGDVT